MTFPPAPSSPLAPRQVSAVCDVVLVVVVDEAQVRDVLWGPGGLMESARPSLSVVVLSTIGVPALLDMADAAQRAGVTLLDCGVTGGDVAATSGVVSMVGGDEDAVGRVRPVLDDFSSHVFHMGPLGAGMSTKLVRNVISYCTWHVIYEAGVLAERSGVDLAMLADVLESSFRPSGLDLPPPPGHHGADEPGGSWLRRGAGPAHGRHRGPPPQGSPGGAGSGGGEGREPFGGATDPSRRRPHLRAPHNEHTQGGIVMADTSAQVQLLIDRLEIDDLLTRYTVALDTRQWDQLATVFTPDATIDYTSSQGIKGKYPEIRIWLEKALTAFSGSQHLLGNRQIELDGDHGTGRTYFFNPNTLTDAAGSGHHALRRGLLRRQVRADRRGVAHRESGRADDLGGLRGAARRHCGPARELFLSEPGVQRMVMPPSTEITCPLTKAASDESR